MRRSVCLALGFVLVAAVPTRTRSAEDAAVKIDDRTKQSVGKALDWLKTKQQPDGSWGSNVSSTAVTSFALLAFLSNGHVPNQGLYGPEVAKAVRYLLAVARSNGYLVGPDGGNMYSHGMATLALTQVYGMTGDEEVKKVLKRAVDLIVKSQNPEGGWRYEPTPTGADISVTIMQVMALRGAKDSGLHVPDGTLKNALKYIDRCYDVPSGGYKYQPLSNGAGYARTAAGVCVLQLCGEYEAKQIERAVKYLENQQNDDRHYWYGHYYAAHALHVIGGPKWEGYYARMKTRLLSTQKPAGFWDTPGENGGGGVSYQTAIAVLILSVPSHYLPIYQR